MFPKFEYSNTSRRRKKLPVILLGILLIVPFFFLLGIRCYKSIIFDIDCGGRLKRAADANTLQLALKELEVAVDYLEKNNMTEGYTSVIYKTPDEDVSFWYSNLKSAKEELMKAASNPEITQLEASNLLMKLRETILDEGEEGTILTIPAGISLFPHNKLYAVFTAFFLIFFLIGGYLIIKPLLSDY